MYRIVIIIDVHYIAKTLKGLKKVKISGTDKINTRDEKRLKKYNYYDLVFISQLNRYGVPRFLCTETK